MEEVKIGQIVHYRDGQGVLAAIVVAVHNNNCVNIRTFPDDNRVDDIHHTSIARGEEVGQFQEIS